VGEKEVQFVDQLIKWFRHNKRNLPWRVEKSPYKIWVSEIMLQQTKVSVVIPYFTRFIERYPSVESLAEATLNEIYQVWEGLGYYSRAKKMHETASIILSKYGGVFPDTLDSIISLPGIGDYTAGAIMSIAFNKPCPAVDGNVLRVFARIYEIQKDVLDPKTKKEITEKVTENIYLDSPSDYTESIMELGALLCQPKNPKCLFCPVQTNCKAYQHGTMENIPLRINKTVQVEEKLVVLILQQKNAIWMEKRKDDGLLGGFWQLPNFYVKPKIPIPQQIENCFLLEKFTPMISQFLFEEKYMYSHRIWKMEVFEIKMDTSLLQNSETSQWIDRPDLKNFPIGGAFRKIIKRISHQ
jgi:A/G-specific adenine glycosylase